MPELRARCSDRSYIVSEERWHERHTHALYSGGRADARAMLAYERGRPSGWDRWYWPETLGLMLDAIGADEYQIDEVEQAYYQAIEAVRERGEQITWEAEELYADRWTAAENAGGLRRDDRPPIEAI